MTVNDGGQREIVSAGDIPDSSCTYVAEEERLIIMTVIASWHRPLVAS